MSLWVVCDLTSLAPPTVTDGCVALQLGWLAAGRKQGVCGEGEGGGRGGVWAGELGHPTLVHHRPLQGSQPMSLFLVRDLLVGTTNSDGWLCCPAARWLAAGRKQGVCGQLRVVGWDDRGGVWCGGLGNPTSHRHRPLLALS
jgi:hypothetical protein